MFRHLFPLAITFSRGRRHTYPARPMVSLNSCIKIFNASSTPACPLYFEGRKKCQSTSNKLAQISFGKLTARPQIGIRPTKTWHAPKAIALKMSEPRLIPPSTAMGILEPAVKAHSRRASRVAGTPSSCRPPWLETTMPSMPCLIASVTSSGDNTPFNQICNLVCERSHGIAVPQSKEGSSVAQSV